MAVKSTKEKKTATPKNGVVKAEKSSKTSSKKNEDDEDDGAKNPWERASSFDVQALKAGVADFANHHAGEQQHEGRERPCPDADRAFCFFDPHQEQRQRADYAGGGGDGDAHEIFGSALGVHPR